MIFTFLTDQWNLYSVQNISASNLKIKNIKTLNPTLLFRLSSERLLPLKFLKLWNLSFSKCLKSTFWDISKPYSCPCLHSHTLLLSSVKCFYKISIRSRRFIPWVGTRDKECHWQSRYYGSQRKNGIFRKRKVYQIPFWDEKTSINYQPYLDWGYIKETQEMNWEPK